MVEMLQFQTPDDLTHLLAQRALANCSLLSEIDSAHSLLEGITLRVSTHGTILHHFVKALFMALMPPTN
jgi:hypothetical protein